MNYNNAPYYRRNNNYQQQQQHNNNYNNNNNNRYQQQNYNRLTATSPFLSEGNFFFNNTQPFSVTTDKATEQVNKNSSKAHPNFPSKTLINFYPHKLRTKEQFFRDNEPPKELEKEKDRLFLAANIYYQMRHFEEESKKWKIYEQVASRKEQESEKDGDDILMIDLEEIPKARPFKERYSAVLNMTITDTDSQSNDSDNNNNSHSTNNSDIDEEDKKKRKLHDTSLSPTSKEKLTSEIDNIIRKKKPKSKKKKKISIENDPRAPEGSPVLLVNENSNKEQGTKTAKSTRPDTPQDPYAKNENYLGEGTSKSMCM